MDLARLRAAPAAVAKRISRQAEPAASTPTIESVVAEARRHRPSVNVGLIERAHAVAATAHEGQLRASGEPYITHPVAVAYELAALQMDAESIAAALLHDVPEDTDTHHRRPREALRTRGRPPGRRRHQAQQVRLRAVHGGAAGREHAQDVPGHGRGHPRRPHQARRPAAQHAHARRPAAGEAGPHRARDDGDLRAAGAPAGHLADQVGARGPRVPVPRAGDLPQARRAARDRIARRARRTSTRAIDVLAQGAGRRPGIKAEITGRPKHIYSIYKKMERKGAELDEIYDLLAVRVLVDDVQDCYAALGVVHSLWRPIPGQFDDYIAMPKDNLYQSLHTAVIGPDGKPLEVQIRTHEMHRSPSTASPRTGATRKARAVDRALRREAGLAAPADGLAARGGRRQEFVEGLKTDLFQDQVFVFTPKGDVKDLPAGRDAARLRLPHPHRRRPPLHRRQGQRPAGAADYQLQERRHRRDHHHQGARTGRRATG